MIYYIFHLCSIQFYCVKYSYLLYIRCSNKDIIILIICTFDVLIKILLFVFFVSVDILCRSGEYSQVPRIPSPWLKETCETTRKFPSGEISVQNSNGNDQPNAWILPRKFAPFLPGNYYPETPSWKNNNICNFFQYIRYFFIN